MRGRQWCGQEAGLWKWINVSCFLDSNWAPLYTVPLLLNKRVLEPSLADFVLFHCVDYIFVYNTGMLDIGRVCNVWQPQFPESWAKGCCFTKFHQPVQIFQQPAHKAFPPLLETMEDVAFSSGLQNWNTWYNLSEAWRSFWGLVSAAVMQISCIYPRKQLPTRVPDQYSTITYGVLWI